MASKRSPMQYTSSWEGTFRYKICEPGCQWSYDLPTDWFLRDTGLNFYGIARTVHKLLPDLKRKLRKAGNLPQDVLPDRFKFLNWAAKKTKGTSAVVDGTALMLNHVVSSGTIQVFKILSSFVRGHLTVQIQNLPSGAPCWFYLKLSSRFALLDEYLLTFPEWFFTIKSGLPTEVAPVSQLKSIMSLLESHRILNEYTILDYVRGDNDFQIRLRNRISVVPYERGRQCGCIPIPGPADKEKQKNEPELVSTPEVVMTSPVVAQALADISRVWQDRFAKSVLISAPPGSGKESFATSIPFGQGRPGKNFAPISLADNVESLTRQIYGKRREDGSIEQGLLATAANSAAFLDEVHQPANENESLRPRLLRPLESGEYFPIEANMPERIDNVLFVLATSTPVKLLGKVKPTDFWTRMTHVVPIKHPLNFAEDGLSPKHRDVIGDFFKFFWWERTQSFYKVEPDQVGQEPDDAARLIPVQQARAILRDSDLTSAAKEFSKTLLRILKAKKKRAESCSIRGIRSMTSRLFSIVANEIACGRDDEWLKCFSKHLQAVVDEILPMALLSKRRPALKAFKRKRTHRS